MGEHPSSHQLQLYRRGALAPALFLTVHRHVSACPSCSEHLDARPALKQDYANLLAALMPEPGEAPYHLTSAELAGYAEGGLDAVDAESAESHLSVCAQCAGAARELRAEAARRRRPRQVAPRYVAPLRAWARPAPLAYFILTALGLGLAIVIIRRAGGDVPAPAVTNQAESAPPNSNQSETPQHSAGGNGKGQEPGGSEAGQPGGGVAEPGAGTGPESSDAIVATLSPPSRRAIASALSEQTLEVSPVLAQLRGEGGTLRGGPGAGWPFPLLSPVGRVVEAASPTFSWSPLAGASSYAVAVADDKLNVVASSGPLTRTKWRPTSPLKRGAVYSWQVTALKDGQAVNSPELPAPQAKFMILDRASSDELRRFRAAAPRHHLGLGVLYARAGLLDEAEKEFRALVQANPRSDTARRLLQNVRSLMN